MKPIINFACIFSLLFIIQSCSEFDSIVLGSIQKESTHQVSQITKASSDQLYYHEDTGLLIEKHEDPFIVKTGGIVTHNAIELRPKNIEEYKYLQSISEDVFISYIPFGYTTVREATPEDCVLYNAFPTGERYYESYDQTLQDSGKIEEIDSSDAPKQSMLPILYAAWPVDLAIPEDIEYTLLAELCFPIKVDHDNRSTRFEGEGQINLPISVDTYDSLLNSYVPMTGIKVRVTYGSFFCDYVMNSYGSATIQPHMFNIDLTLTEMNLLQVYVIYQSSMFTVSRNDAITPIQRYLGTVSSLWGVMMNNTTYSSYVSHQVSQTNECDIFQAAYYYYNGAHDFSNLLSSSEQYGIIIHASTDQPETYLSRMICQNNCPTIYVYDVFTNNRTCIGSTLHELGHVHHVFINNSNDIDSIIKESFASYVGWYIGEHYYYNKGYILPFSWFSITGQNRQDWSPILSSPDRDYSPLFVDLTDDYNQPSIDDPISGVPVSVINDMVINKKTVSGCKTYMSTYVGVYLTATELDDYFDYYL